MQIGMAVRGPPWQVHFCSNAHRGKSALHRPSTVPESLHTDTHTVSSLLCSNTHRNLSQAKFNGLQMLRSSYMAPGLLHCPRVRRVYASSSQGSNEEYSEAPKKKKMRLRKPFEYLASRPQTRHNYLLYASGAIIAIIMRRAIIEEIQRWPGFFMELWEVIKALGFLIIKFLATYAKEPTAWTLTLFGWAGLFLLDVYNFIVEVTPVTGLIKTIASSTLIMSIGEAVRTNAAANQPWIIGFATLAGLGAFLSFWDLSILSAMLGILSIISYIRHRDLVTALMPAAATLVAVGDTAVKVGILVIYMGLSIYRNWAAPEAKDKVVARKWTSPPIFVAFAIAIGINVAVNWLHARHIVWLAT